MTTPTVHITISLPEALLEAADQAIKSGKTRSRNELIADALRHELVAIERSEIDVAFAQMAEDQEYQDEARQLVKEFDEK